MAMIAGGQRLVAEANEMLKHIKPLPWRVKGKEAIEARNRDIFARYEAGESMASIGRRYGVKSSSVIVVMNYYGYKR